MQPYWGEMAAAACAHTQQQNSNKDISGSTVSVI
jgi:hypothetical protein